MNINYSTQLPTNNQQMMQAAQNQIIATGNFGANTHQILLSGNNKQGQRQQQQNPGHSRGYSNNDGHSEGVTSKYKKKNGRLVSDHLGIAQMNNIMPSNNGSKSVMGQNSISLNAMNSINNQNRKLTPSKVNIGIRGNSGMSQIGRSYEQKKKMNSRSNTIEIQQKPAERESRKNIKRDKRGAATSLDYDHGDGISGIGANAHILGASGVQVSQTGTLLIGPGGRPKTSSGKHNQSGLHNGSATHNQQM